jgi:RimJ/RimL family protein N-acetyltransferase
MSGLQLVDVDEDVLEQLVHAATTDATADEVTAPVTPGPDWTPQRTAWLRALHRDRRAGVDGPLREATWAVVVDGAVVGAVRLKRTADDGVLETGVWLTRSARGRALGAEAVAAVVRHAADRGARAVRADTTVGNLAAQATLRRLGFALNPADDGRSVSALLVLADL